MTGTEYFATDSQENDEYVGFVTSNAWKNPE